MPLTHSIRVEPSHIANALQLLMQSVHNVLMLMIVAEHYVLLHWSSLRLVGTAHGVGAFLSEEALRFARN